MDAKDILGLPRTSSHHPQEKKPRPPRESQRKPDGISREVYALTGGLAALMPAVDISHLKPKLPVPDNDKISWQWRPFTSSARTDNLQLHHWVRVVNGVPPTGDYSFAKYNKSVDVIKYTDEEYEKHLIDPMWTKEETDQLFDLCERFDLRFIIIADRFPSSRSVEELKNRYYSVSRSLLISRASSPSEVSNHPIIKEPYNVEYEVERKRALCSLFSQTRQQEHKEAEILAEAKRIAELRKVKDAEEAELANTINDSVPDEPVSPTLNIQNPFTAVTSFPAAADDSVVPASLRRLPVYLRTSVLSEVIQAANASVGLRTTKRIDQTLQDLGVNVKPKVPTKDVCAEHLELRKEILALLNLQKHLQFKEAEASANRDSSYIETPGTPKRSHRVDQDRSFAPDSLGFGGDRVGKRDHKRKAPGRFSETPPSPPQSKRPRKLKASEG